MGAILVKIKISPLKNIDVYDPVFTSLIDNLHTIMLLKLRKLKSINFNVDISLQTQNGSVFT
jgi:hypothetical protein